MGAFELLATTVGVPLGKFLLKSYLSEPAGAVGGSLLDLAKDKIKDFSKSLFECALAPRSPCVPRQSR